jgi:MATE family multidrug resistance protein
LASKELGIVWGVASNIYILMSFFSEGLNKAIATMTSNMIGKQALQSIEVIYKKFMLLLVIFCSLLTIPMVFFPDIGLSILNIIREDALVIRDKLLEVLKLSLITVFLESAEYTTWGLLLAGGDTKYPMVVSQICLWGGVVIPVTVLYYIGSLSSIKTIFSLMILCFAMSFFLIYKRYKSLKWYKKLV